ncbi:hypothetical protein L4D09_01160 [Photobacterium makurazakiensis]
MLGKAITTIGMCVIGGKYLLMLILAAVTVSTGAVQADMMQLAMIDPVE